MFGSTTETAGDTCNGDNLRNIHQPQEIDNKQISFLRWINPFSSSNSSSSSSNSNNNSRETDPSPTIEEYKGVQSLKQFWNSRINGYKDHKQKAATLDGNYTRSRSLDIKLSPSKSIDCLIEIDQSASFDETIGTNRSEVDNFYKYKTAATKKRSCLGGSASNDLDSCRTIQKSKVQKISSFGTNFPLIAATTTGEKIHWAKREDIIVYRKQKKNNQSPTKNLVQSELSSNRNTIINTDNVKLSSCSYTNTEMAIKSSAATKASLATKVTDKTDSGRSNNGSTNSLSSDLPVRRKNPTSRKYSFKTHAKNYYTPRKMAANAPAGGSKVAALTHQFNQMIQKDATILREIQKNNGILLSRAGHVYKVMAEGDLSRKKTMKKNSSDDDASSRGSRKKLSVKKLSAAKVVQKDDSTGTVRAAINKFEKCDAEASVENSSIPPQSPRSSLQKPKVPVKSEHVLQRTREIAIRNSQKRVKSINNEHRNDLQSKILEEIQEESKLIIEEPKSLQKDNSELIEPIEDSSSRIETIEQTSLKEKTENQVPPHSISTSIEPPLHQSEIEDKDEYANTTPKKSKYTKIYEKFKFRYPFKKSQSEDKSSPVPSPGGQPKPEQKIIDALETVNKKIDHLSKSTNDVRTKTDKESFYERWTAKMMRPNDSFLFRRNSSKTAFVPTSDDEAPTPLVEAVNTRLINKTQSMDETRFASLAVRQTSIETCDNDNDVDYPILVTDVNDLVEKVSASLKEYKESLNDDDEDLYEHIEVTSDKRLEVQKSFLFTSQLSRQHDDLKEEDNDEKDSIYQTVAEAKGVAHTLERLNSYESYENYESVPDESISEDHEECEDGYEICDPPDPPPPRKSESDGRNVDDELPELPVPKRIISNPTLLTTEKIREIPPRPPKSPLIDRTKLPAIPDESINNAAGDDEKHHDYDDENIYDTIKCSESTAHCYEEVNHKSPPKSLDAFSMTSNCYESINSIRRNSGLRHSDSVSTLSSEQKTNSLYGMSIGQNPIPPSEGCSDNSDEWIDISDGDEDEVNNSKHHFVVVRERAKCHRSTDWSQRVRDQRIHQQEVASEFADDDSDHYYEPLFVAGDSNKSMTTKTSDEAAVNQSRHHLSQLVLQDNKYHPTTAGENSYSDEYDSFETDDESDEDVKKHDSGVDISNVKLPDPPATTNHAYALVKKIKNFIIKKNPPTSRTPDNSRPYENTQFYVDIGNQYQNTKIEEAKPQRPTKLKTPKFPKKSPKQTPTPDDTYENTEFHSPHIPKSPPIIPIVAPATNTNSSPATTPTGGDSDKQHSPVPPEIIARKKSKSAKSFKSKFRKSLVGVADYGTNIGNALNGTRSTFYISDSVDVDSGIFEKAPNSDSNLSQGSIPESMPPEKCATVTRKKKSLNSPELNRRKTTIGIRPANPPPPPPVDKKSQKKRSSSTTSWYTECGVFKANAINDDLMLKDGRKERTNSTSWYAEAGLYQTSGASVASSSGSSGVSTGGEGGPGDDNSHSMFLNEPLYQIYTAAKLESIRDLEDQESSDGYEEIGNLNRTENRIKPLRPTALQLIGPKQGPSRTLWSEIPEVINSAILATLTPTERRLQEAKFEILTSEASYLKSLNVLRSHFMNHPAFRDASILSPSDRKTLFSHMIPVQECSDRLLCDLENCWQDNIMLLGLSKNLYKHAEKYFHVYIAFCEQQGKMDRTLRRLKEAKGAFNQNLEILESDAICVGQSLYSFLMLPMQRITRLPLLIDAVFSKLKPDSDEYEEWKMTLAILNKIVQQCDEAARRCEQAFEIERISRQIEFPSNIRSIPIAPAGVPAPGTKPRTLVKKGELTHLIWRGDDAKLTFGKKFSKTNIYAFLFTDLLVLTKRRTDEQFTVFDYCPRSMLTLSSGDVIPQLPTKDISQAGKNLIFMTLLENHEKKTVEMLLSCPSISEQQRWLEATAEPKAENPGEKLYEQWDCPQVIAKHEYVATEPDLLGLEAGDVVNVTRKMADGWYQGERIRDGATGWFPGNFTEEVNSPHVRARNLKQRYRLLTFTATYLESQKKK